jgi:transposase
MKYQIFVFLKTFFALQIFEFMGKKSDLSPRKVALIKVFLDQKQKSQREIAKRLQISQKSVNRVSQAVKNGHGYSPARVGKCGRKTKLSPRTQRKLVQVLLTLLQEIRPDDGLEKTETYCLIDYIVGLCVYCH